MADEEDKKWKTYVQTADMEDLRSNSWQERREFKRLTRETWISNDWQWQREVQMADMEDERRWIKRLTIQIYFIYLFLMKKKEDCVVRQICRLVERTVTSHQ